MSERLIVAIAEAIRDSVLRVGDVDGRPLSAERAMWASPTRLAEAAAAVVATEVATREAAAAEAMRASMLREIRRRVQVYRDEQAAWTAKRNASAANLCAAKAKTTLAALHDLEALPLPAADALARARDQARAEGIECAVGAMLSLIRETKAAGEADHDKGAREIGGLNMLDVLARRLPEAIRARGKEVGGE